jgi:hypothetical protein
MIRGGIVTAADDSNVARRPRPASGASRISGDRLASTRAACPTVRRSAGGAPISVQGDVLSGPATRTYQVWYRDAAPFCQPDGFNLTNGSSVVWLN